MKKNKLLLLVVLVLVIAGLFAGCTMLNGKDGTIFGSIWWDSYSYGSMSVSGLSTTGGFPSSITKDKEYEIKEGSYHFSYDLYDSSYGWSGWWYVSYSVKANPGKLLFADGADKHFTIDCYYYLGPVVTGTNIVASAPSKAVGVDGETVKEYTDGDYTITLSYKKVDAPYDPDSMMMLK